ncbi:MAG: AsmA family protein, partial [Lewinella sp.]|nr:AsmA family protein [Lewinella sp.]
MTRQKVLKRLLWIVGIFFALIILAITAITSVFEEPVGRRILTEVNKQITTELSVEDFDLSFFTTFPNLSANLRGVALTGANDSLLLAADQLSFRASVFSLLGSRLKVRSVLLADGELNISVDAAGQANYDIMVPGEDTPAENTSDEMSIDLQEAILRNVRVSYRDLPSQQRLRWRINEASFNGAFSSTAFTLHSQAETHVDVLAVGEDRYVLSKPFSYEAAVDINTATGQYTMEEVSLQLGDLPLLARGTITMTENLTDYDLQLASDGGTLAALLDATPSRYLSQLDGLDTRGDFDLQATIQGQAGPNENPRIDAAVNFSNGELSSDRMDGELRDLSFTATFTNGDARSNRTSVFEIDNLKGYFQRELLEMRLKIVNLDEPDIDFAANGAIGMGIIAGLIPDERVTGGRGEVEIANLR